jgi:hypothetical protein
MAGGAGAAGIAALASVLLCTALAAGCAADGVWAPSQDRLVHRRQGFSVPDPARADAAWRRVEVERAALAYARDGGARLSLHSECDRVPPAPQVLARALLIGIDEKVLRQSGPVAVRDWQGWSQVLDVQEGARVLRLKTVTLVAEACSFDFVLVAGDDFEALETGFDAWWAGFLYGELAPPESGELAPPEVSGP